MNSIKIVEETFSKNDFVETSMVIAHVLLIIKTDGVSLMI